MIKNETIKLQLRRVLFLVLVFAFLISLTSCRSKDITGNVDMSAEYASIGDFSVTNGELWNEMKWDTADYLNTRIEKAIVQEQYDNIKSVMEGGDSETKTKYTEKLRQLAIKTVYSLGETDDYDTALEALTTSQKNVLASKYLDSLYLSDDITIDVNTITVEENYSVLYESLYYTYAKVLKSYEYLADEMTEAEEDALDDDDEDTIGYYAKSRYISGYKEKFLNTGDIEFLSIRFMNDTEVNTTLKSFGIKIYKDVWYQLTAPEGADYDTFSEYCSYYDDFDMADASTKQYYKAIEASNGKAAILALYIEMYNYIYTDRTPLQNISDTFSVASLNDRRETTTKIMNYFDLNDEVTLDDVYAKIKDSSYIKYTSDELEKLNTSLKSYVYDTLTTDETDDTYIRYSTNGRNYGSYYYLMFKLDQVEDEYESINTTDISSDDLYESIVGNETLKNSVIEYLMDSTVNDDYVSKTITTLKEDVKIKIFDKNVEIAYAAANSTYSKNHSSAPDLNTIATINIDDVITTVTFDQIWDQIETENGAMTAVDLLTKKIIKSSDLFKTKFTKSDIEAFKDSLDYVLTSFANGNYESSGYPSSIGKYNFMLLYFHSANIDTIIDSYYKVQDIYSQLLTDYTNTDLLDLFLDYTTTSYENYFSISASRLFVYIDIDEDGKEDPISDWTAAQIEGATELLDKVVSIASATTDSHATTLDTILAEYNSSSRFEDEENSVIGDNYNPTTPESTWAKYRRLGLYLTIKTDDVSNSSGDDVELALKNRMKALYNMDGFIINGTFPSQYLDSNELAESWEITSSDNITVTKDKYLLTENGLNLIVVTSGLAPASAKYENDDDLDAYYTNINVIYNDIIYYIENIYNDDDSISMNQMKLYLYEYLESQTSSICPNDITSALTTFFVPVITRYLDDTTQRELLINYAKEITSDTIEYADSTSTARFNRILLINQSIADEYKTADDLANNFAGWWTNLAELSAKGAE